MTTPAVTTPPSADKAPTADDLLKVTGAQPAALAELTYTFPDGSVVKGASQDELLANAAKRYDDLNKHAQQVKAENAQLRTQVPQTVTPATPANDLANLYWDKMAKDPIEANAFALARYFGYETPEQMKRVLDSTVGAAEQFTELNIASQFLSSNQDFPLANPEALGILTDRMVQMGVETATPDNMSAAHALCIKEGKYKPAEAAAAAPIAAAQVPNAPPMLTQSAAMGGTAPDAESMANRMTPAQLRDAIEKMQAGG